MRTFTIVLTLIALASFTAPATAQSGYQIEVSIEGFNQPNALLAYYFGNNQYIKDTVEVKDGTFTFSGEEALDQGFYLVVLPPTNRYFELVVGEDQHFSVATDTVDMVNHMVITGSEENAVFYDDLKFVAKMRTQANELNTQLKQAEAGSATALSLKQKLQEIDQQVKAYRKKLRSDYPDFLYTKVLNSLDEPQVPPAPANADSLYAFRYYRSHFLDNVDFQDSRLLRTPVLFNKANTYVENLTYKIPDSIKVSIDHIIEKTRGNEENFQFFVVHFLNKYAQSKIMGMDEVYVHMVETYYMTGEATWTDSAQVAKMTERALAISPTIIGKKAPNLTMQDVEGKWQTLYNVDADFTILFFWSYDCGHCQKEAPKLAEFYQKYKSKGVELFTVSINGDRDEWKEALEKYKLEGISVEDHYRKSGFDKIYDVRSTPRLFVLDKDKVIRAKHLAVDQLEEALEHFMKQLAAPGK